MSAIIDGFGLVLSNVAPFFILLGLLIFVHELGHFLVAKFFGVRVETFSLGFGKKILSYKYGDTVYCISAIPLGGYVKMFGDDPSREIPEDQKPHAFLAKPVMQRVAIVLAGPLMNLFFAVFVFTAIAGIGSEVTGPYIGDVAENTKAFAAGFRSGDKISAINGKPMPTWNHIRRTIEASGGRVLEFTVERNGEPQPLKIEASPQLAENENIFSTQPIVGQIEGFTPESRSAVVGVRDPKSAAGVAGLKPLDLILSIDGQKVSFWRDLNPLFEKAIESGKTSVTVQARDLTAPDKPENIREVSLELPRETGSDLVAKLGLEPAELYIFQIKKGAPADLAGVRSGDRVLRINNEEVHAWTDVLNLVKSYDPNTEGIQFTVLRDGEEKTFLIKPEMTELMTMKGQEERRFTIGITPGFIPAMSDPVFYRVSGLGQMMSQGLSDTVRWTEFIVMSVVRLVQGEVSAKNIGGVITIGRVASHSFEAGLSIFLQTMAIISINLFLINLLPVPVLDGGHLLFYAIEIVKGTPLSLRKMELAQQIGLMLLMFLMAFAFFNDITNWLNRW